MFGFSEHPYNSGFYGEKNKKKIGKMKVDTKCVPIVGFVWWKTKMCACMKIDNEGDKKAKGINKNVVGDELKYEDDKNLMFNRYETWNE